MSKITKAMYAFSADPITNGHINIVERIANTFDTIIVGIGNNSAKKYLFSLEERLCMAKKALKHLSNVSVVYFTGMLVDFATEQNVSVIVKGVRNAADFDYEETLHLVGLSQDAGIDTHILFADPSLTHISSSTVKAIQLENGNITEYVPTNVKFELERKISNQLIIGVTGEIAAGKSTLSRELIAAGKEKGINVYDVDLDKIGHDILSDDTIPMHRKVHRELVEIFGDIRVDGCIDRKKLGEKVFGNATALEKLNTIFSKPITVHLRRYLNGKEGIILLNGALIVESGYLNNCNNYVILIDVGAGEQTERLKKRGHTKEQIKKRVSSQWSFKTKYDAISKTIENENFGKIWVKHQTDDTKQLLKDIIAYTKFE